MSDSAGAVDVVGVLGDGDAPVAAVESAAGSTVASGDAGAVYGADPDVVVVGSPAGLRAAVRTDPAVPVLGVDLDAGVPSVAAGDLPAAVEAVLAGEWTRRERTVVSVSTGDHAVAALLDATVMTAEPARISEYAVASVDERGDDQRGRQFRADGVVVATPAGTRGYARAAGGPVLSPGVDAAAVVPVAPFTVDRSRWVLRYPVSVTVERDEGDVALFVDGVRETRVPSGESVVVEPTGVAWFAAVPDLAPGRQLEKT